MEKIFRMSYIICGLLAANAVLYFLWQKGVCLDFSLPNFPDWANSFFVRLLRFSVAIGGWCAVIIAILWSHSALDNFFLSEKPNFNKGGGL